MITEHITVDFAGNVIGIYTVALGNGCIYL